MSIENYYNSQYEGCRLSDKDQIVALKKIERDLNKRKIRRKKQVIVQP